MPVEKFKKCIKISDIYVKKIGESELYFINQDLTK